MGNPGLHIELKDLGKKFGTEWVFKNLNYTVAQGDKLVILGGNGSGKSTLLQIIAGYVLPNHGDVYYTNDNDPIENDQYKNHVSLASPYLDVVDEFSLSELISHCALYKPFQNSLTTHQIVDVIELSHTKNKALRTFSSGMRQRVKLGLAVLSDCPVLLLDEPASNLDRKAVNWYQDLVKNYASHKTIIVCSNSIAEEYSFCSKELDLMKYK